MSEKKCSACGNDLPWGYIFTIRHERYDPTMDICQKCRVKRARERREKEAADARRR